MSGWFYLVRFQYEGGLLTPTAHSGTTSHRAVRILFNSSFVTGITLIFISSEKCTINRRDAGQDDR